ncbi:MAG TPA: hypothetical protein VKD22_09705, partial [Ramlibacter sp.]|nr:hypothetical protein [Ramlibacter sp.]
QFYAHTWLLAADPAAATAWPAQAAQSGVTAFSTATFAPDLAETLAAAPHVAHLGPPAPPAAGLTIRHVTVSVDDQRQPDK